MKKTIIYTALLLCITACHYNEPKMPDSRESIYQSWLNNISQYTQIIDATYTINQELQEGDTASAEKTMLNNKMLISNYSELLSVGVTWKIMRADYNTMYLTCTNTDTYTLSLDSTDNEIVPDYFNLNIVQTGDETFSVNGEGSFCVRERERRYSYNHQTDEVSTNIVYNSGVFIAFSINNAEYNAHYAEYNGSTFNTIGANLTATNAYTGEELKVNIKNNKISNP